MLNRRKLKTYIDSSVLSNEMKADLRKVLNNNKVVLPGWSSGFLRALGEMKTIIDVGVLNGTPALYSAFPDAYLILVEALPMYEDTCQRLLDGRKGGEIHMCAVGASDGSTRIRYYPGLPATSSLLLTDKPNELVHEEIDIPLRRLDGLIDESRLVSDILLKIDVEGMELEVLRGAVNILPRIKYIIAETSIRRRHQASYRFADLVAFLAQHGFDLYDALRVTRSKAMRPGASIMDAIFVNAALQ